ncbi:azurin [Pseudoteredinibacter isoporae]|uniref:Azurin n=1 Tax=Pseudoteredinibacter isoporae TaxID=570281 RepID=A0A7X0MZH7_9GAMM|nr:azurin [Pseudoteredinibacter isoporae]MBB6523172.1 azurin [Pseudoteredinibacter isoporae]NHO88690.1 azurin [Pseudoteredinibacter isoporae]NIB22619.1 azurin [Pseudoteredinibacter isoporae]
MKPVYALPLLMFASSAFAACDVEIEANDAMRFNKAEMVVDASCKEVTVTLKHTGKLPATSMGHNWVLSKTADVTPLATAGMSAGVANSYLPAGDARVLAATKVIGGGESTKVTFDMSKLQAGGDYSFFCSFPGHWAIMKGKFVVK